MGAHEPPTNRSFYLSLGASTLRFAIIVGLVVAGIVVIDQAFPAASSSSDDAGAPLTGGTPTTSQSPSPATTTGATGPEQAPSPTVVGVSIAVFNGANVTGLAADTTQTLIDEYGYVEGQDPADAPTLLPVTTIYYRGHDNRVEAEYLANDFFVPLGVDADVEKLNADVADVDPSVDLAIFLGNDYAAAQG